MWCGSWSHPYPVGTGRTPAGRSGRPRAPTRSPRPTGYDGRHEHQHTDDARHAPSRSGRCWPTAGSTPCGWSAPPGCARSTPTWPATGAQLHHSVGSWPLLLDDSTEVLEVQPGSMLALKARAWPAGAAEVRLHLRPRGAETEVVIEEDARRGPGDADAQAAAGRAAALAQRRDAAPAGLHRRATREGLRRRADRTHPVVRRGRGRRRPQRAGRREPPRRRRLVRARPRGAARGRAARCAAPATSTPTSCTTRSAPSTRSRPPRRSSGPSASRSTGWPGGTRPAVLGHPKQDGEWAAAAPRPRGDRRPDGRPAPRGRRRLAASCAREWDRIGPHLVGGLLTPFPPVRAGLGLLARLPRVGGLALRQDPAHARRRAGPHPLRRGDAAAAARRQRRARRHPAGRARLRADGAAAGDARPDRRVPGARGWRRGARPGPGPAPGVARRRDPLRRRGRRRSSVDGGRATGVALVGGERVAAGRAVVADVVAPILYGRLVAPEDLPERVAQGMRSFQLDPVHDQGRLGPRRADPVGQRRRRTTPAPSTSPTRWSR